MNDLRESIEAQFPNVHITFLSVLIGFAIEDLVSIVRSTPGLYEWTVAAVTMWLQALSCVLGIVVAWLAYTLTALSRRSVPTPLDTFNILILASTLFVMNSMIGQPMWQWWYGATLYMLVGGFATYIASAQIRTGGPKFEEFTDKVQSWKGPLSINFISFFYYLVLGTADYYGFVAIEVHLANLAIGWVLYVVWISLIYHYWRRYLTDKE